MQHIGINIQTNRIQSELSQQQLADKLCVTQQSVAKWEKNTSIPQADRIQEIADIFNVPVESIMCADDKNFSFSIPIDNTDNLKSQITELKKKCSHPNCSYQDKLNLVLLEMALNSNSPTTGSSGQYITYLIVNEYEYNIWKALKTLNPNYNAMDYLKLIQYRITQQTVSHNS